MTDPFSDPNTSNETGTPRWVKVFAIIALIVVLLLGILKLTGFGGEHGPSRHAPPVGITDVQTASADPGGYAPPEDGE
jgi:hypothetical protein